MARDDAENKTQVAGRASGVALQRVVGPGIVGATGLPPRTPTLTGWREQAPAFRDAAGDRDRCAYATGWDVRRASYATVLAHFYRR